MARDGERTGRPHAHDPSSARRLRPVSMPNRHDDVVGRFAEACRSGDIAAVRAILDADVIAVCDGGGLVPAPGLTHGADGVARLVSVLLVGQPDTELTLESVNGRCGLALRRAGQAIAVVGI